MKNPASYKVFYLFCALILLASFFFEKEIGYGLILGAALSYVSTLIFNKQKACYEKTKQLSLFLVAFALKYLVIALVLYLAIRYSRSLFKGAVFGFLLNQIALIIERIRLQKKDPQ